MKKQIAVLVLSTALLAGCNSMCNECRGPECAAPVVKERLVLDKTSTFAFDSAVLTSSDKAKLNHIIDRMKLNPQEMAQVNGYTDSTGPAAYNMGLSERRAMAVKDYMVANGIAADRITTKGYGASNYVASNATAEGRAQNRRTEIICHD